MSEKQPIIHLTVRIPPEIAELLRRLAKQHDRSRNGEIVRALRAYAEEHKAER
jgi:predicted transcriptional regulator